MAAGSERTRTGEKLALYLATPISASGSLVVSLHQFFDEPTSYIGRHSRVSMHQRPIVQHRLGCVQ